MPRYTLSVCFPMVLGRSHCQNILSCVFGLALSCFRVSWPRVDQSEWFVGSGIPKTVDEDLLREHFFEQLGNCDCMKHALNTYDAADPGDEARTYSYLMAQANRQIALGRQRGNEEAIKSRLSGKASTLAPANPSQQHCAQWVNKGSCKKGAKCNDRHDANRKGSPAASSSTVVPAASVTAPAHTDTKGKGKGKDKKGNPNAEGGGKGKDDYPPPRGASAGSRPRFEYSKGKCSKADKCPFTHRKLTSEEKAKRDEWARAKEAGGSG